MSNKLARHKNVFYAILNERGWKTEYKAKKGRSKKQKKKKGKERNEFANGIM